MRISDWSSDVCSSDFQTFAWHLGSTQRDEIRRLALTVRQQKYPPASQGQAARHASAASHTRSDPYAAADVLILARQSFGLERSEERRDGRECVSTCGSL